MFASFLLDELVNVTVEKFKMSALVFISINKGFDCFF